MSEIESEMRDRMLHLVEGNEQDGEEYKQLEAVLNNRGSASDVNNVIEQFRKEPEVVEPRYPTDERLVTCYCENKSFIEVGKVLEDMEGVEMIASQNVHSHTYFVRGIPNILAYVKGVQMIGWRTQEQHDTLRSNEK